jgi:hypothetical protein
VIYILIHIHTYTFAYMNIHTYILTRTHKHTYIRIHIPICAGGASEGKLGSSQGSSGYGRVCVCMSVCCVYLHFLTHEYTVQRHTTPHHTTPHHTTPHHTTLHYATPHHTTPHHTTLHHTTPHCTGKDVSVPGWHSSIDGFPVFKSFQERYPEICYDYIRASKVCVCVCLCVHVCVRV